jgi:ADP-heptose:LPS heptosyltransferase
MCDGCTQYVPFVDRVLIVKLGAMGDVLRTAALLPDIAARHENPKIVWLTKSESVDLLAGNPLVHRVVSTHAAWGLAAEQFDAVYALDSDEESLGFAGSARTSRYHGFVAGKFGTCVGVAPGGDPALFEMGVSDELKRSNRRTYLDLLAAAAGLRYTGNRPWLPLRASELEKAALDLAELPRPLVGLNVDAGARWQRKSWNGEYVVEIVSRLVRDGYGVALFGTGRTRERNELLAARFPGRCAAFESAGDVPRFVAGIAHCQTFLTADTLGMHIAWALQIPTVALFGPTSLHEIDLGEYGTRLAATDLACLGCYLETCAVNPHCMDRLTPDIVYAHVRERLPACV